MSGMGICAFFYMCNWCGIVVLHICRVDWRVNVCHGYMLSEIL